jgi:hypothetical protein
MLYTCTNCAPCCCSLANIDPVVKRYRSPNSPKCAVIQYTADQSCPMPNPCGDICVLDKREGSSRSDTKMRTGMINDWASSVASIDSRGNGINQEAIVSQECARTNVRSDWSPCHPEE